MLINCCKKIDKFSLSKWATISSKRIIGGFPNFFEIAKELNMKKESKSDYCSPVEQFLAWIFLTLWDTNKSVF